MFIIFMLIVISILMLVYIAKSATDKWYRSNYNERRTSTQRQPQEQIYAIDTTNQPVIHNSQFAVRAPPPPNYNQAISDNGTQYQAPPILRKEIRLVYDNEGLPSYEQVIIEKRQEINGTNQTVNTIEIRTAEEQRNNNRQIN